LASASEAFPVASPTASSSGAAHAASDCAYSPEDVPVAVASRLELDTSATAAAPSHGALGPRYVSTSLRMRMTRLSMRMRSVTILQRGTQIARIYSTFVGDPSCDPELAESMPIPKNSLEQRRKPPRISAWADVEVEATNGIEWTEL